MFDFEEYIPLETVMRLTEVFLKNPHHKEKILEDKELYDLYKIYDCLLYSVIKPKSPSHVFENVSKITITGQNILFYPELIKIYNKEMAQGRKLVFPKSLKKLTIRVDNYDREFLKFYEFELNEGLEDLSILEDMITLAINDAFKQIDDVTNKKLGKYANMMPGLIIQIQNY